MYLLKNEGVCVANPPEAFGCGSDSTHLCLLSSAQCPGGGAGPGAPNLWACPMRMVRWEKDKEDAERRKKEKSSLFH